MCAKNVRRSSFRTHGSVVFSGRPTARNLARYGTETQDTFGYNTRSELTTAHVNSADYSYAYDAIGNRTAATEAGTRTAYTANKLNQYTAEGSFRPTFDADGNQTLIKTSTGTWNVTYNAKNRPVRFEKADSSIVVECTYDTMGRRATKKVTTNGTLTEHRRFLYRGYLQIDSPPPHRRLTPAGQSRFAHCPTGLTAVGRLACCDLTRAYTPALWFITWDPTQPTATRPLAIQKNGTWYTYDWDLTKNICETYRTDARIDLAYTYTPYGEVSPAHSYDQPLRWSSEYHDTELGLVYYNYRHYNPAMGRWMRYDPLAQYTIKSRYTYSSPIHTWDRLGLFALLQCKRYKWTHPTYKDVRLTSTCTFEILEPSAEYCCKCSKEKQELDNAKTKKSAEIAIDKLINCIKDDKDLKYTARADFIANTGIHSSHTMEGDGYGKDQRLPVGLYRITPGHSDLYGDNTPGITALNRTTAGEPAPLRTHVWIHYAWGNTNAGAETKGCLAFIDRQDLIIQRAMMDQKNCGGVYLLMNEGGDAKPGQVELFMKIAERVTILLQTK